MTCLGWKTKKGCPTRGTVQVTPDATPVCPDITWFYLAAGVIGVLAMMANPPKGKGLVASEL